MDKKTVFIRTAKGEREFAGLQGDLKRLMSLIDNKSTIEELTRRAPPSLRADLQDILEELLAGELICDKDKVLVEPKIVPPKAPPKMFVPKPAVAASSDELDFTHPSAAPAPSQAELAAKQKAEEAARARAEMEAAFAAAQAKSRAEAAAKAEAKARLEAELAARAKAEEEARAKQDALLREQAEAKARQEAEARRRAEEQAARVKAEFEAAIRAKAEAEARARAEIEAAARAKQEAEEKARREAEEKARREAEEKARREAEEKARREAEEKARREAEEKARREAEEKARREAEEKARREAEEKARREAEEKARREAEEKARREAEERARQEAEAARLKVEQEAAARAKAQAEAETAGRLKAEQEAARQEEAAKARTETEAQSAGIAAAEPAAEPAFEINLNAFLGGQAGLTVSPDAERASAEAQAREEAEKRAAAEAKAAAEMESKRNAAAEMARLKAEAEAKADAARQKAEAEARRQAEERALADEQAKAWAEAEQRAKAQAKIDAELAAQQAALSQAKATQKPVSRARRTPLPLGKIAFGLIALALLAAVVIPYVYPLQEYVAPLEQRLSAQLDQPVRIGSISAASLPPTLRLQNVTVGKAQEVKIGSVALNFDLLSLLSEVKVIGNAELQDVRIEGSQLDKQMASLSSLGEDAQYPIRHLTLQRVQIVTDEVAIPVLNGVADLDVQGVFSRVALHSPDDRLGLDLQPNQGRWQLEVAMRDGSLPMLPGVMFGDLNAKGVLGDGEVNFGEMDAHIYGGILLGSARLSWRKGWQLQGQLEAKTFELNKMFPQYRVEGELYGEGSFSMSGAKLSQLGESPRLNASFTLKNGVVNGIDMVETARLYSREHMVGGRTHFDDMIGVVQVENHEMHFRQLRVVSGMLRANGAFEVSPSSQLSGSFKAEIKMRSGDNLLTLFGTLAEPKLRAGR
jgi:hypothetical protein